MKNEMRAYSVYKFYKLFNILWSNQRTRIRKYYIIHIKIQKKKRNLKEYQKYLRRVTYYIFINIKNIEDKWNYKMIQFVKTNIENYNKKKCIINKHRYLIKTKVIYCSFVACNEANWMCIYKVL